MDGGGGAGGSGSVLLAQAGAALTLSKLKAALAAAGGPWFWPCAREGRAAGSREWTRHGDKGGIWHTVMWCAQQQEQAGPSSDPLGTGAAPYADMVIPAAGGSCWLQVSRATSPAAACWRWWRRAARSWW